MTITYAELVRTLRELVTRCDGEEGVRADGSNIQTIRAHAVLEQVDTNALDELIDATEGRR